MVVYVDLEEDDDEPNSLACHLGPPRHLYQLQRVQHLNQLQIGFPNPGNKKDRTDQVHSATNHYADLFASVLACYPYAHLNRLLYLLKVWLTITAE